MFRGIGKHWKLVVRVSVILGIVASVTAIMESVLKRGPTLTAKEAPPLVEPKPPDPVSITHLAPSYSDGDLSNDAQEYFLLPPTVRLKAASGTLIDPGGVTFELARASHSEKRTAWSPSWIIEGDDSPKHAITMTFSTEQALRELSGTHPYGVYSVDASVRDNAGHQAAGTTRFNYAFSPFVVSDDRRSFLAKDEQHGFISSFDSEALELSRPTSKPPFNKEPFSKLTFTPSFRFPRGTLLTGAVSLHGADGVNDLVLDVHLMNKQYGPNVSVLLGDGGPKAFRIKLGSERATDPGVTASGARDAPAFEIDSGRLHFVIALVPDGRGETVCMLYLDDQSPLRDGVPVVPPVHTRRIPSDWPQRNGIDSVLLRLYNHGALRLHYFYIMELTDQISPFDPSAPPRWPLG